MEIKNSTWKRGKMRQNNVKPQLHRAHWNICASGLRFPSSSSEQKRLDVLLSGPESGNQQLGAETSSSASPEKDNQKNIPSKAHVLGPLWHPERTSVPHPLVVITRRLAHFEPGEKVSGSFTGPDFKQLQPRHCPRGDGRPLSTSPRSGKCIPP